MSNEISPLRSSLPSIPERPISSKKKPISPKGKKIDVTLALKIKGHIAESPEPISRRRSAVRETANALKVKGIIALKSQSKDHIDKAIQYFEEAAKYKDRDAMLFLGELYLKVKKDPETAFPWLLKGSEKCSREALRSLAATLTPSMQKKHRSELIHLFNKFKAKSARGREKQKIHVKAEMCLGFCYEKLIGTNQLKSGEYLIKEAARTCYVKAAEKGEKDAMIILGDIHSKNALQAIKNGNKEEAYEETYSAEAWYGKAGKSDLAKIVDDRLDQAYGLRSRYY